MVQTIALNLFLKSFWHLSQSRGFQGYFVSLDGCLQEIGLKKQQQQPGLVLSPVPPGGTTGGRHAIGCYFLLKDAILYEGFCIVGLLIFLS